MTRSVKAIEADIAKLQAELEEAKNPSLGEPENAPAVLFFEKHFRDRGKTYTYVAVKVGEKWAVTGNNPGRNPNPKTWSELVDFIDQAENDQPDIWLASELVKYR